MTLPCPARRGRRAKGSADHGRRCPAPARMSPPPQRVALAATAADTYLRGKPAVVDWHRPCSTARAMNQLSVAKVEKGAWEPAVLEAMARLLPRTYSPNSSILEDELLRCDTLYVASDAEGLLAFRLVAQVRLLIGAELRRGRYLGLSAVRADRRGSDAAAAIHARASWSTRGSRSGSWAFAWCSSPWRIPPLAPDAAHTFDADEGRPRDSSFPDIRVAVASAASWLGTAHSARGARFHPARRARHPGEQRTGRRRLSPGRSGPQARRRRTARSIQHEQQRTDEGDDHGPCYLANGVCHPIARRLIRRGTRPPRR